MAGREDDLLLFLTWKVPKQYQVEKSHFKCSFQGTERRRRQAAMLPGLHAVYPYTVVSLFPFTWMLCFLAFSGFQLMQ